MCSVVCKELQAKISKIMLKSNEIQRNQARCTSLSAYGAETLLEAFCFRLHLTT